MISLRNVVAGRDVRIFNETTILQYQEAKRKRWRDLEVFSYPSFDLEHDIRVNIPGHLIGQLHRNFAPTGYQRFVNLMLFRELAIPEPVRSMVLPSGHPMEWIIAGQYAGFIGGLHQAVRSLWDSSATDEQRRERQTTYNAKLQELQRDWSVRVQFLRRTIPTAHWFTFNPEGRSISIEPDPKLSTDLLDYPDQLRTTSEIFLLLSALAGHQFVVIGDLEVVTKSYALAKYHLAMLDREHIDFNRFRVNVDDPEEWDFINAIADREFAQRASSR